MPFRYLRDRLFLLCFALYVVNRWGLKQVWHDGFLHEHLNDLICIPFWVPIMLWVQRRLGLRPHDAPPLAHEVVLPLVIWSFVFEVWLPTTSMFQGRSIGDPLDVLYYSLGALIAAIYWRWKYAPVIDDSCSRTHVPRLIASDESR